MIGLSLSFCVKDIIEGRVDEQDCTLIIAATNSTLRNEPGKGVDYIINHYRDIYWKENPDKGAQIARRLFAEGRVFEAREFGGEPPDIADGHWLTPLPGALLRYNSKRGIYTADATYPPPTLADVKDKDSAYN
jgi:hypothetical protein